MLYAIGEILLVMIGILLALQVNNWNESRKAKKIEEALLEEIKMGIENEIIDMEFNRSYLEKARSSQKTIIEWLESDRPYSDTLCYHFSRALSYTFFIDQRGPYETLKSLGMYHISDKQLKNNVTKLYEIYYDTYIKNKNDYMGYIKKNTSELLGSYFDKTEVYVIEDGILERPIHGCVTPISIIEIKRNYEYKHFIKTLHSENDFLIKYNLNNCISKAKDVKIAIESYLK